MLPPSSMSLRKNISEAPYVSACVRMEKYTPLIRERNARKPNTRPRTPGSSTTIASAKGKLENGLQKLGSSVHPRNTRKSGIGL